MSPYLLLVPLVVAISLVYSASRHEAWARIWSQAFRFSSMILGILLLITVILLVVNTQS
jgi:hypothetical protein